MFNTLRSIFLRNQRLSLTSLGGIMVLAVVGMGIINLTSLNEKALQGYKLNKLENERQELVTDGEITDMLSLRSRSMDQVKERTRGMVAPERTDITYVMPVYTVAQNTSVHAQ